MTRQASSASSNEEVVPPEEGEVSPISADYRQGELIKMMVGTTVLSTGKRKELP